MNNSCKYFFNRSFEVLHRKSFDSYRLSLNNPFVIFDELNNVIEKYLKKKVKHFDPTISEVGCEALDFLQNNSLLDLMIFEPFTKNQIIGLLDETCNKSKNDKKIRSLALMSKTILSANKDFKKLLFKRIVYLIEANDDNNYQELDTITGWLYSQLIHLGFSKTYIESRVKKCGDSIFKVGSSIEDSFKKLDDVFNTQCDEYNVIFKLKKDPSQKLKFVSTEVNELNKLPQKLEKSNYLNSRFKEKNTDEIFVKVKVQEQDFWSAISSSYQLISTSIEINVLHNSENNIIIESQAVAIHESSKRIRVETIEQAIDGFYQHNPVEFARFITNLKNIESETAKEKISSAIRFYKLGNESIEMEHKILNYWIGFEQLFSAVDSNEDSINRMKTFYTSLNISYYFQRRVNYLIETLARNYIKYDKKTIDSSIFSKTFDKTKLSGSNPLLLNRLELYFGFNDNKELKKYIEVHSKRLNQHLTRIYRVRNELVHEGKTKMNTRLIAGHLRHYLLFSIEQVTNELSENPTTDKIDDVFVYFENLRNTIKQCSNLQEIISLKTYKGYMQ